MPRFGVAFNRRRSTATSEDFQNGQVAPEQPSFRVIERNDPSLNRSFDGGARMARGPGAGHVSKPSQLDLDTENNMFADLKVGNRGSGASNTTKATSTDASSRHSNASTAPSSTDFDDSKYPGKKNLHDIGSRAAPKSSGSGFLNRAGRTFSFGVNKKNSQSSSHEASPEIPPVPTIQHQDYTTGRARGMTDSTTSTATPPKLEEGGGMDLGGDFGSMFSSFDKRASMATLKNLEASTSAPRSLTGNRSVQPAPLSINKTAKIESSPASWNSGRNSNDSLLGPDPASPEIDVPPPVPRHQSSFKMSSRPSDIMEDEDAKLLQDSITVGRMLSDNNSNSYSSSPTAGRFRRDEDTFDTNASSFGRRPLNSSFKKGDDNMFEGTIAQSSRIAQRYTSRAPSPPRNKVMTPAQFEKYRKDKERQSTSDATQLTANDDDDDEINYDDDEDDLEKSKQQAKQRRKQEAHMAVYRQQMMKVTGEQPDMHPIDHRASLLPSMSAPQLHLLKKTPSPGPGISDEDEDEEIPLAILQAHGFPNKNRPPTRLSTMGSNPNMRASVQLQPQRPGSALGEPPANTQRHSTLPAFARNLPQDPFVGASISKPAIRESMSFAGGLQAPQGPPQQSLPVGGLVGVIAHEERSRAMRRGSPNIEGQKLIPGMNGPQGFDAQMMYGGGMGGMPNAGMGMGMGMGHLGMGQMPPQPPSLSVGDQAQLQMTQQMSQFMQMQMQFMQMMASNQQGTNMGMPQMGAPYGGLAATQSMNDLSSRHSMMFEPSLEPPRLMDPGMRTMSMVQPPNLNAFGPQQPGYAGSIRGSGMGYTPSIAPSERSNVGLPGRYRPVSQLNPIANDNHRRTNTMSGALGRWDESQPKATINIVKPDDGSDEDDEEGWEAMKAKRDKKRSMWKSKKGFGSELSAMI